jgi:cell division septation protein DedD
VRRFSRVFVAGTLIACGGDGGDARGTASAATAGPDPIVVRVPRDGGLARAYRAAALDSVIWRATHNTPPVERILAFDQENGFLAFADRSGSPGWIDLRLGAVRKPGKYTLTSLASADGWAVYGIANGTSIVRMTPSGDWELKSPGPVLNILPLPDGTLFVLRDDGRAHRKLLQLRPPEEAVNDSIDVPIVDRIAVTQVGDRIYLGAGDRLLSVAPSDISQLVRHRAADSIAAIAPTPSGDRVFVANTESSRLERFDRYSDELSGSVLLPGMVRELRMDPLGRLMLARPASGDSAWVVSLGPEVLIGTVRTSWRADLPAVAIDGSVATLRGTTVAFVDPASGRTLRSIEAGGDDVWFFARWNGFRPRARGIDQPVSFRVGGAAPDTPAPRGSTTTIPPITVDSAPPPPVVVPPAEPPPPAAPRARSGWTLSFAAVLSLERARVIAAGINIDGTRPRIAIGEAGGTTVYRVVLGPYETREAAERMGRASGHSFWVYEGVP